MAIRDESLAAHFLSSVSYYRLAGYWWSMQADKASHQFKPGSTFENAVALYNFDRELRLLLFDVIERIEIGLRTKMIYHISHELNPWWFENASYFRSNTYFTKSLDAIDRELKQSKEVFIVEHYSKHKTDSRRPPAWKTLEITSFGTLSKLYGNLKPQIKSKDTIAAELKTVNHTYLHSWLQSIAQIRNICAHHSRLWNKNLPGRPKLLKRPPANWINDVPTPNEYHKLYIHVCCMKYLLDVISPGHHFGEKLQGLLAKYPNIDLKAIGFKPRWKEEPLWK